MSDKHFANTCLNKDLPHNTPADTELASMTDHPRADAEKVDVAKDDAAPKMATHRATIPPTSHRHLPKGP